MSTVSIVLAYYNDNDPFVCEWLVNLARDGHITTGPVDARDIEKVPAYYLEGYDRCHFFAGIGGWDLALNMAGWTGPVWTGSCPCQPFSSAGKRKGTDDERHVWPAWLRLIAECRPPAIFGEQVSSRLGREWLAGVRADLEALGYAVGAADLCAASQGAPHIRQRLWWVAFANGGQSSDRDLQRGGQHGLEQEDGGVGGLGNAAGFGLESVGESTGQSRLESAQGGQPNGPTYWSRATTIPCADGKARRVEPGVHPLATGIPQRVGRLRAYGNSIVPQVAATFIRAVMECQ